MWKFLKLYLWPKLCIDWEQANMVKIIWSQFIATSLTVLTTISNCTSKAAILSFSQNRRQQQDFPLSLIEFIGPIKYEQYYFCFLICLITLTVNLIVIFVSLCVALSSFSVWPARSNNFRSCEKKNWFIFSFPFATDCSPEALMVPLQFAEDHSRMLSAICVSVCLFLYFVRVCE